MLKKLLLLSFAAFTMAACNDEADDGVRYATHNPSIVDGIFLDRPNRFMLHITTI
mgnify:CR=1 FL=1